MNNKQNDYVYDNKHSILASLFHTNMYNAVTSGAPPIVGIRITDPDDWFYTTTGHFIACYGIMSDKSKYALADPGAGYVGEPNWRWYNKTAGVLWDAYSSSLGYIA